LGLSFLSPLGALVALAVVVPLLASAALERRAARVREVLRLQEPGGRSRLERTAALTAVAVLLGLAAAQPVLARAREKAARSDAEVLFVFDVSKSMQASLGRTGMTRFARAKSLAVQLRAALGDVPAGIATMTDRTLPHLFPSANAEVFDATVHEAFGIENPPASSPGGAPGGLATTLGALAVVATKGYFSPGVQHRLLVVLSDDESLPFETASIGAVFRKPPRIHTIFIRFWNRRERVYRPDGKLDVFYRPDPSSAQTATTLANATRGRTFREDDLRSIVRAARTDLGSGEIRKRRLERARTPIAGWLALAAILPLGLILRRRNL
jgi:hypothetical protein